MPTPSDSTRTGESQQTIDSAITVDDAAQIYRKRAEDARKNFESSMRGKGPQQTEKKNAKPSTEDDDDATERQETADDEDADESQKPTDDDDAQEGDDKEGGKDDNAEEFVGDEAKVKIKVGDEEHVVDVKNLKRLFGQEAALTKRSQEIAQAKKGYEEKTTKAVTALENLAKRAQSAYEPYAKIDWAQAAKQLSDADYRQLKADAEDARGNLKFVLEELDGQMKAAQEYATTELKKAAKACAETVQDMASPHYIEDWSKDTYGKMRDFALTAGLSQDVFDSLVDPAALKIIHDAMSYRAGKAKAKEVVTKAKAKVVSEKQLRPAPKSNEEGHTGDKAAMARLQKSGSLDDAAAVYTARAQARRRDAEQGR